VVKVIDFGIAKATGEQLTEKTPITGLAETRLFRQSPDRLASYPGRSARAGYNVTWWSPLPREQAFTGRG
jgi:hypothetical protein